MAQDTAKVWLITGCSTGFGRAMAQVVLKHGERVVVTARDRQRVADLVPGHEDQVLALSLDVTRPDQIQAAVAAATQRFGAIDVLVNNAGYGYQSSVEEGDDTEIRAVFETNVFGLFALTRAVLPGMRERHQGYVINITSLAGISGFAASGYYAATKHAVEGWADSLHAECRPLGIRVTCIEPGPYRTDWAGRSLHQTPSVLADYAETTARRLELTSNGSGHQPGDPVRAAELIFALSKMDEPPRNVALGTMAMEKGVDRLKEKLADFEAWRDRSLATEFPTS
ncbi:MAG TPA: oxidoreductase [Castellaniella sp.]|uniref:oxidoreductase n=1 Tax=Castellaniella sp. TaxID=1955812 RepID=UPI002EDD978B